ncbi:MAG: YkgJ family cysteine cluster protein [Deltaproteobacteria bacterium]|nr:YkgJ family cysteine cluster protein [Deltaproteobacteria bacterium]
MEDDLKPIEPDTPFRFECSPNVACFNECCRDLNQFLYPYDILRLKKRLALSSGQFLKRYTTQHVGPESGLPVVALKPADAERLTCPFVTPDGCRVYSDRPASCRMYPLARAISRNRKAGRVSEHFMLLKEPHCLGFNAARSQTAGQWLDDQQIRIYNHFNDQLLDIIRLKNQLRPGPLDPQSQQLFYVALYDLERFRTRISEDKILDQIEVDPRKRAAAESDDTVLLEIGMEWVKQMVFNK